MTSVAPGMTPAGYLLAVDIGTTFTAAAVREPGRDPRVFPLGGSGGLSIPSAVARSGDELLFGRAATRRASAAPDAVATEFKRRMGDETPIILSGTPYGAEALTGALLGWVVERVSEEMGDRPSSLVLAHPANWGPYKLDLLREASRLAGYPDPVFVPEPVAAAAHYAGAERMEVGERVAVYDLGGGTFDTAVVERTDTGFEILGEPHGMDRFGGIDLDYAILTHVRRTIGDQLDTVDVTDPDGRAALRRLGEDARLAKEALSEDAEVSVPVALPSLHTHVRVTREEFEDAIRPRLRDTVEATRRAIDSAGLAPDDISRVLLVGGASRVPLVADSVRSGLGRPVALDANPKHSVCLGAASTLPEPSADRAAAAPLVSGPSVPLARWRRPIVGATAVVAVIVMAIAGWALASGRNGDTPSEPAAAGTLPPSGGSDDGVTTTSEGGEGVNETDKEEPSVLTTTTSRATTTTTIATTTTTTASSTAVVPSLVGKSRTEAIAALEALDLGYQEERSCFGGVTDLVVYQSPEAGYVMPTGGGSDKTVYFGSEFRTGCSNTTVNAVIGLTRSDAVAALEANGLLVSVTEACFGGPTPGIVVGQSPDGGASAPQGWTVAIDVQASGCG